MASRLVSHTALRILVVGLLVVLAALLIVPRVSSEETSTLEFVVVFTEESFETVPALGNEPGDGAPLGRGDLLSGQGAVYAAGDPGGERIGTWYFMGVGTAEPQHFETAANHFFASGYLELFGEGTLTITGLINFATPYTAVITGGSGMYAGAGGQCTPEQTEEGEVWECEVR